MTSELSYTWRRLLAQLLSIHRDIILSLTVLLCQHSILLPNRPIRSAEVRVPVA